MSSKKNAVKAEYLRQLEERNVFLLGNAEKIVFNFRYFISGKGFGQSFEEWQAEGILAEYNEKLKEYSRKTIRELKQDGILEIYEEYPLDSGFKRPEALKNAGIKWGRLRLTGRRRVIGCMCKAESTEDKALGGNTRIFYVVFLDKEHEFAPSRKK